MPDVQIYARGGSQAVDGRLVAALQALGGGEEDAEAFARAAVGTRCREVHAALLIGPLLQCDRRGREHSTLIGRPGNGRKLMCRMHPGDGHALLMMMMLHPFQPHQADQMFGTGRSTVCWSMLAGACLCFCQKLSDA